MSLNLKLYIGRKITDCLHKTTKISPIQLQPAIQIGNPQEKSKIELNIPLNVLESHLGETNVSDILKIQPDDIIKKVQLVNERTIRKITFEVDRRIFIEDVMTNSALPNLNYDKQNIVVEYSSPNVAKPFHYGHLRSTIIGNFLSNLNKFNNHNVTRLNYLGDWGTQFGFIQVGLDALKYNLDMISKDPIKLLYQSYVHANELAIKDKSVLEKAKKEFEQLEHGSEKYLKNWKQILNFTREELMQTYKRLGVEFDEYHSESMYSQLQIADVIHNLREKNLLIKQSDGKQVAEIGKDERVTLIKSDGTTLYLTRDVAAAIDRFEKYNFDKMYYVVGNAQNDHFHALKCILNKMDMPWADRLVHVKFGVIRGMSTRKGTAIFLKDILDECKELVVRKQIESPTTKVPITDEETSDILGVTCVIINDLKQRRQKDYEFDWNRVLQVKGDTGIKLQYTHCRLHSLAENCGATAATECNADILREDEAIVLLKQMAKFPEILHMANEQLEACVLVTYLFHLCNSINKALQTLQVKDMDAEVASQRLLLFNTAREVLKNGMTILGIRPLTRM